MMPKAALFYVSGHGFGHAVRTAQVIRELVVSYPGWSAIVRTEAPQELFQLPSVGVPVHRAAVDTGVAEKNGVLEIDSQDTLRRLRNFFERRESLIAAEVEFMRRSGVSVVVADVPFVAGEVASRVGVPCLAIANFTWDWIYEPFLTATSADSELLSRIRDDYGKMRTWLRLPFSHDNPAFRCVRDVPLITRRSNRNRESILREIGLDPRDSRRRVLLSSRGPISSHVFRSAVEQGQDFVFLHFDAKCRSLCPNAVYVERSETLTFVDVLGICDAVISKLGYGILADCIGAGCGILYPPREGFREDELLRKGAAENLRAREIPMKDFQDGRWAAPLRALLEGTLPPRRFDASGARTCAEAIVDSR